MTVWIRFLRPTWGGRAAQRLWPGTHEHHDHWNAERQSRKCHKGDGALDLDTHDRQNAPTYAENKKAEQNQVGDNPGQQPSQQLSHSVPVHLDCQVARAAIRPSGVQVPARGSTSLHQVVSDSNTARVLLPLPNTVTARTVSMTTGIERHGTRGSTTLARPSTLFGPCWL